MIEKIKPTEHFPEIQWHRPTLKDLSYERGEIERTIKEFLGEDLWAEHGQRFLINVTKSLLNGEYRKLDDETWSQLENTDSWKNVHEGDLQDVQDIARKYDKNYSGFIEAIFSEKSLPAPIILKYKGRYHKVAGNTRLMFARGLGQKPSVLIGEYQEYED